MIENLMENLPPPETMVTRFTVRCGGSEVHIYVRYEDQWSKYSVPEHGSTGFKLFNEWADANGYATRLVRTREQTRRQAEVRKTMGITNDGGIN